MIAEAIERLDLAYQWKRLRHGVATMREAARAAVADRDVRVAPPQTYEEVKAQIRENFDLASSAVLDYLAAKSRLAEVRVDYESARKRFEEAQKAAAEAEGRVREMLGLPTSGDV